MFRFSGLGGGTFQRRKVGVEPDLGSENLATFSGFWVLGRKKAGVGSVGSAA